MSKRDPDKELWLNWSKKENDIMLHYPRKCDGWLMHDFISEEVMQFDYLAFLQGSDKPYTMKKSLIAELKERGYDIESIRFYIKLKQTE